ncbi:hypothetical protein [Alteromonas arenosi]|uniref:hypothetical protein n=1 Tax=Alteromonas arenosi TaxID=3055817 RepID=UPI0025A26C21|nr:hypothetical protein [Alteromonas sp. ASW11-36]
MKSSHNPNSHMLISRKKPQTTASVVLSLVGFLLFLTGGLVAAASVVDAVLNSFALSNLMCFGLGVVSYKLGRVVMVRCTS